MASLDFHLLLRILYALGGWSWVSVWCGPYFNLWTPRIRWTPVLSSRNLHQDGSYQYPSVRNHGGISMAFCTDHIKDRPPFRVVGVGYFIIASFVDTFVLVSSSLNPVYHVKSLRTAESFIRRTNYSDICLPYGGAPWHIPPSKSLFHFNFIFRSCSHFTKPVRRWNTPIAQRLKSYWKL